MPSVIWLIDRSRVSDGRGFCQRARYDNYHAGPAMSGIARKATKVPLMTGIAGHDGLAPILQWCAEHPDWVDCPPDEVIRAAVAQAIATYWKVVERRGFAYLREDENVKEVTREQCYLIEGLIWSWCLEVLPEILRRAQIVEVEHDETYVFECTCGLGDGVGSKVEHDARECAGKGLMCKPDFLALTRLTQELEYHEFKTSAMDSITFRSKWEVLIQMFAATLDAERRHGKHVQSVYIHGLIKGKREGEWNPETGKADGTIRQQSVMCYGWKAPAMPPMEDERWAAQYNYTDPGDGKRHRLPKAFKKTGVWEIPDWMLPQVGTAEDGTVVLMSKAEFWAKWLPDEVRRKQLVLLGPFSRQSLMVDHFIEEAKAEETRWQGSLWELYDVGTMLLDKVDPQYRTEDPHADWWRYVWPDPEFQNALNRLFPRSYECRRYGERSRCQFENLCFYREGWDAPLGSGQFIERRPHHVDETVQLTERGLLLPEEGAAEDAEEPPW